MKRNWVIAGAVVLIAAIAGSGAVLVSAYASQDKPALDALRRERTTADHAPPLVQDFAASRDLDTSAGRRVADATYVIPDRSGKLCVISLIADTIAASCLPEEELFDSGPLFFSTSRIGQPEAPAAVRIFGVAESGVSAIRLSFGDSLVRNVPVTVDGGFAFDADGEILATSARLAGVSAFSASGAVVRSQQAPSESP